MAFHVEMGGTIIRNNLNRHQPIIFESVKQNFGNAYDTQLGAFICPKSGLYFFSLTIMSHAGQALETKIVVNGSTIAYAYAGAATNLNTGTKSVIVPLQVGDRVWVEFNSGDNSIYGGANSVLTGFIIKET